MDRQMRGLQLLETPLLNKGTAFTEAERRELGLEGLLPAHVDDLENQVSRAYQAFQKKDTDLERHIFLRALQDTNEVLFYKLASCHLEEMLPLLYTPVVGEACQQFSEIYRRPRGLFISYPQKDDIEQILDNAPVEEVRAIVVTDGERILGLGDQGAGGMGIPIGKLSLYTALGGVNPAYTLPILLDVGTNNPHLCKDPLYIGWRHERISDEEYYGFIDAFVQAVKKKFPSVLLQWEDFAKRHASLLLERYRDQLCTFNDDIQGTAAVATGTLFAAVKVLGSSMKDQRVAALGAGSAGVGICTQILAAMVQEGLSEAEARRRFYLVDCDGLLREGAGETLDFQKKFIQPAENLQGWEVSTDQPYGLLDVVKNAQPTILIGVSGQPEMFTQEIIQTMASQTDRPIIFPLSNPTSRVEASPANLLKWTQGKALVATGSPFQPVHLNGNDFPISQCNNSYVFPGLGLGILTAQARRVSDEMMMAAAVALSECSPAVKGTGPELLPPFKDVGTVAKHIALAVGTQAQEQGLAEKTSAEELAAQIEENYWEPAYGSMEKNPTTSAAGDAKSKTRML